MSTTPNIEEVFIAARDSYRFLHEFQSRLKDTIDYFVKNFDNYIYSNSEPVYTCPPTFRSNPHTKWILDLFPAYAYSIRFENNDAGKPSSLLELRFKCDEGHKEGVGEDELPSAVSTALTSSLIAYIWVNNDVSNAQVNWRDLWYHADGYPKTDEAKYYPAEGISAFALELNIHELANEKGIKREAVRLKKAVNNAKDLSLTFK